MAIPFVGGIISTVLDPISEAAVKGATTAVKATIGLFTDVSPDLSASVGSIDHIRGNLHVLVYWIAAACIVVQAIRMMLSQNARPLMGVGKGLVTIIIVEGSSIAIYNVISNVSNNFAKSVLGDAGNGDAGTAKLGAALGVGGFILALCLCIVCIFLAAAMIVMTIFRGAMSMVLLSFLPVLSAGTIAGGAASAPFKKVCGLLFAAAIFPGVAGIIWALAIESFVNANGFKSLVESMAVMLLAVLALPALIRLVSPVAAMVGGMGGAEMAAIGAAAMPTGAKLISSYKDSHSSSSAPATGSKASSEPSGAAPVAAAGKTGAAGATGASGAAPAAAAGSAGATGAAGAATAATGGAALPLAAGAMAVKSATDGAKKAANNATTEGGSA